MKTLQAKKRIYLGLISLGLIFVSALIYLFWYLTFGGFYNINRNLPLIIGILLIGFVVFIGVGIIGIVYSIIGAKPFPFLQGLNRAVVTLLMPIAIRIGRFFDIEKEEVERSFIAVNNRLLQTQPLIEKPKQILLLLPHCLQQSDCPIKITVSVDNCRGCGRCCIHSLRQLSRKYGVHLFVASGGTLARKIIRQLKPRAIIAVACERDLTSGILDCYPIPVLGILNERPEGPCLNTRVDLNQIENALQFFLTGGRK